MSFKLKSLSCSSAVHSAVRARRESLDSALRLQALLHETEWDHCYQSNQVDEKKIKNGGILGDSGADFIDLFQDGERIFWYNFLLIFFGTINYISGMTGRLF